MLKYLFIFLVMVIAAPAFAQQQQQITPEYQVGLIETLKVELEIATAQSAKFAEQLQFARKEIEKLKAKANDESNKPPAQQ